MPAVRARWPDLNRQGAPPSNWLRPGSKYPRCHAAGNPTDAITVSFGYWLLAIGYWLLAIGYWLLAIGYWLLAIGYWLLAIGYWLLAIGYWLFACGIRDSRLLASTCALGFLGGGQAKATWGDVSPGKSQLCGIGVLALKGWTF